MLPDMWVSASVKPGEAVLGWWRGDTQLYGPVARSAWAKGLQFRECLLAASVPCPQTWGVLWEQTGHIHNTQPSALNLLEPQIVSGGSETQLLFVVHLFSSRFLEASAWCFANMKGRTWVQYLGTMGGKHMQLLHETTTMMCWYNVGGECYKDDREMWGSLHHVSRRGWSSISQDHVQRLSWGDKTAGSRGEWAIRSQLLASLPGLIFFKRIFRQFWTTAKQMHVSSTLYKEGSRRVQGAEDIWHLHVQVVERFE